MRNNRHALDEGVAALLAHEALSGEELPRVREVAAA
jgi:hypothetical protein